MNLVYQFRCYKIHVFQEKIQKYKNLYRKYIFYFIIILLYNNIHVGNVTWIIRYMLKIKAIN